MPINQLSLESNMYNISAIKTWIQSFLLPIFIFIFSSTLTFAENSQSEAINESDSSSSNRYINSLETVISDYKKIAENGGWPSLPNGKPIKMHAKDTRIPVVRQILSVMGDYHLEYTVDSETLDEALVEAIKKFQIRHGLEADGAIGKKTQAALAVPVQFRIAQMQANLERMREMPDFGERYILVNIAGYYLQAVDKNTTAITSRIIVGTPKNATPLFHSEITDVSFNPQWHVPERIARDELMEKLREDPEYFIKGDYMIKDHNGETVNATEIDWENHSGKSYRFVQRAGDKNALGKVKFSLPDTNSIYLHSTGSPKLFNKPERALSHGCIRVEMARDLVYFVMENRNGWNEERISKLYDSSTSRIISVEPVPVYTVYWTSWVDETTKRPYFYVDIYGRDKI